MCVDGSITEIMGVVDELMAWGQGRRVMAEMPAARRGVKERRVRLVGGSWCGLDSCPPHSRLVTHVRRPESSFLTVLAPWAIANAPADQDTRACQPPRWTPRPCFYLPPLHSNHRGKRAFIIMHKDHDPPADSEFVLLLGKATLRWLG